MKKRLTTVLACLMAAVIVVTGCSQKKEETTNQQQTQQTETSTLRLATGGSTGTYYAYGGILAGTLNSKMEGVNVTVQSTGASKANIFLIEDKEAELAIVQNDVMDYAYNGTDLFAEEGAASGFSAVAGLYAEVCQIVAVEGINSVEDLKGKSVSVGDAGSGVEFNARQILEAYGLTFEDINVQNLGFGDSADALKDGKIDAFFCTAGAPTTAIVELATTNSINLIGIDDEHAAALIESYPYYTQYIIPAASYVGVDEDVATVAVKATLIASDDLSEDVVYNLLKTIFDNKEEITKSHAKGAELDLQYAVEGISIPFHAGAAKYFEEVGALQ